MKKRKSIYLIFIILSIFCKCNVYAVEQLSEQSENGILTCKYVVKESEENEFLSSINNKNGETNIEYKLVNIGKTDKEENKKNIVKTINKDDVQTSNKDEIRNMVSEIIQYDENGYFGNLPIDTVDVEIIENGQYEEIEKLDITFENEECNDLNQIDKEIIKDGKTYYLVGVDWQDEETREVQGSVIPVSYKGTKHYETVVEKDNPSTYNAIIKYSGEVELKDKFYQYEVMYEEIEIEEEQEKEDIVIEEEQEIIEEEKNDNYIVPIVVISGIGIVIITFLILTKRKENKR